MTGLLGDILHNIFVSVLDRVVYRTGCILLKLCGVKNSGRLGTSCWIAGTLFWVIVLGCVTLTAIS